MTKHHTWRLGAVAALLLAAGPSEAGVQDVQLLGWLGEGNWELRAVPGRAYLVESPDTSPKRTAKVHTSWTVSAPAIKTWAWGGKRLGYAAKGRAPSVRLVSDKSDDKRADEVSTAWAFEIVSHIRPWRGKVRQSPHIVSKGHSGVTFRAMAKEGPFKGWYLATKEDGKSKKSLVLVREKKNATVFRYVEGYSWVKDRK
jgi:hypothetical protein